MSVGVTSPPSEREGTRVVCGAKTGERRVPLLMRFAFGANGSALRRTSGPRLGDWWSEVQILSPRPIPKPRDDVASMTLGGSAGAGCLDKRNLDRGRLTL